MKNKYEELIDRYINHDMTIPEREQFEQQLETNPELRAQFLSIYMLTEAQHIQQEEGLQEVISGMNEKELQSLISGLRRKNSSPTRKKKQTWWIASAISACAVVLCVVFYHILSPGFLYQTTDIYAMYFDAPPKVEYSRSGKGLPEKVMEKNDSIIHHYTQQEYETVIRLYETAIKDKEVNELPQNSLLLVAYSAAQAHRSETAIQLLIQLALNDEYSEEATWWLLSIYLQNGERDKAIAIAEKLMSKSEYYAEKASNIYNLLKEKR